MTQCAVVNGMIETFTGRMIDPLDPHPEQLDIKDIAHALANVCRFQGHTRFFYSVAQHCCLASGLLPHEYRRWGLLHDASEAYLCDLSKPVKARMPQYRAHEDRLMQVICVRFGLAWPMPAEVDGVDMIMLATERRDLMPGNVPPWNPAVLPEPTEKRIRYWHPEMARRMFLDACEALKIR